MSLTLPFGFISSQGPKPFDFQFVEKLTNIGSDGTQGPDFSNARNQDVTYNSNDGKFYIIACGGSTDTYHYDYSYPSGKSGNYVGKANPGHSNRGIAWNGGEYVETYFQNLSGTKTNPTQLAKYDQNTAGTGSFDLQAGSIIDGPNGEHKAVAYESTTFIYALTQDSTSKQIKFIPGYTGSSTFTLTAQENYPTGCDWSRTYEKFFVVYRNLDGSGNGIIDMYDYDFVNPDVPTNPQRLIMSASDIGSAGGNVFRLAGLAIDNSNNNLIVLHNNAGTGTTQNKSEAFVYSLDGL